MASVDESVVFDFAFRYLTDREDGRVHGLAHYLARFPGHDEAIAREFLDLERDAVIQGQGASPEPEGTRGLRIDHYELRHTLGEGGQAVVYLALDLRLGRDVALKVLATPVGWSAAERRTRFRREAETLSRLNHPGICDVYDAALDGARPYIAMRYVEGQTLAQRLRAARQRASDSPSPRSPTGTPSVCVECGPRNVVELRRLLALFEKAARALHVAHEAGVVHRDIKPGNIMVDAEGTPVLLDFGLARAESDETRNLTRTGVVFGTPAYMSPEQVAGSGADVDRRSDVYSLGVTLLECLTLDKSLRSVEQGVLRPRAIETSLPQDLRVVIETTLEPERGRRYATALDLAEDLRRVLAYEPIHAKPMGRWLRLRRWTQRHPALAAGLFGSAFFLLAGLIASWLLVAELEDALADLEGSYYRDLAGREEVPERALLLAIDAAERDPGYESNMVLVDALERLSVARRIPLSPIPFGQTARWAATSDRTGLALLDGDGLGRFTLPGFDREAFVPLRGGSSLCASLDGKRLVAGDVNGELHEYAAGDLRRRGSRVAHGDVVTWLGFSPDGARFASASLDGSARIWDATTWMQTTVLDHGAGAPVVQGMWSPDSRWLITRQRPIEWPVGTGQRAADQGLWVWDVRTGRRVGQAPEQEQDIRDVAFDPTGKQLVTASAAGTVIAWSTATWEPLWRQTRSGKVNAISFDPHGGRLAIAWDPTEGRTEAGAAVLDAQSGAQLFALRGHEDRAVATIEFDLGGQRIATSAYDGTTRVWDAAAIPEGQRELVVTRGRRTRDCHLVWGPESSVLLEVSRDAARLIRVAPARIFPEYRGNDGEADLVCAELDASGGHVLTADALGRLRIFDPGGQQLAESQHGPGPLAAAAFLGDGELVLSAGSDRSMRIWDWADGGERWVESGSADVDIAVTAVRSRDWIVLADSAGTVRVLARDTGEIILRTEPIEDALLCAAVSTDQRWIAAGTDDRAVVLYAAPDFRSPRRLRVAGGREGLQPATAVAFDARGERLVAVFESGMLQVWDMRTWEGTGRFGVTFGHLALSDSDDVYAGAAWDGTIQQFNLTNLSPERRPERSSKPHSSAIHDLQLSRDGRLLASASADRTCRLVDAATLQSIVAYRHPALTLGVQFAPGDHWVLSACRDGVARLLPADPLAAARAVQPCDWGAVRGRPTVDGR